MYAGFTTLQDMNSPYTYATVELRDAINKGEIVGRGCRSRDQRSIRGALRLMARVGDHPVRAGTGNSVLAELSEHKFTVARPSAVRDHSHYGTDWIKIYETEDYEGAGTRSRTALARSCRTAR